jgi:protein-disulfide isomerase
MAVNASPWSEMTRASIALGVLSLAAIALLAADLRVRTNGVCGALTSADKVRLTDFVRLKHNLPSLPIELIDGGPVLNSCFRQLTFVSRGKQRFRAEFFLSPDFRFLTSNLSDAMLDPKALAEQRQNTLDALVRGPAPARGDPTAPSTVAIFSDFECPYCARFADTAKELAASEGSRVRIVYHYFPLSMHRWALPAAIAGACAERQNNEAFWSLHDFLFAHQKQISDKNFAEEISGWASNAPGLSRSEFDRCVSQSLMSGQVEQDLALGGELGVEATPTVFVNGNLMEDHSLAGLRAVIESRDARQ